MCVRACSFSVCVSNRRPAIHDVGCWFCLYVRYSLLWCTLSLCAAHGGGKCGFVGCAWAPRGYLAQLRAQHMHSVCQLSVCSSVCAQRVCSCISASVLSVSMCSAGGSACVQLCVGNSAQAFLSLTLIVLCRSSCHRRPGPLQVNFDKGMQFTVLWTLLTNMDTCPWTVNLSWAAMMNP